MRNLGLMARIPASLTGLKSNSNLKELSLCLPAQPHLVGELGIGGGLGMVEAEEPRSEGSIPD